MLALEVHVLDWNRSLKEAGDSESRYARLSRKAECATTVVSAAGAPPLCAKEREWLHSASTTTTNAIMLEAPVPLYPNTDSPTKSQARLQHSHAVVDGNVLVECTPRRARYPTRYRVASRSLPRHWRTGRREKLDFPAEGSHGSRLDPYTLPLCVHFLLASALHFLVARVCFLDTFPTK